LVLTTGYVGANWVEVDGGLQVFAPDCQQEQRDKYQHFHFIIIG
jgi:hypothetical protein